MLLVKPSYHLYNYFKRRSKKKKNYILKQYIQQIQIKMHKAMVEETPKLFYSRYRIVLRGLTPAYCYFRLTNVKYITQFVLS